jgi:primosomal protein N' (replication factor Y)
VQVAGRAGRSGKDGQDGGDIYIETQYPESAVFQYLLAHDVDGFLSHIASERQEIGLPPFLYQALVHAEAKSLDKAIQFLSTLKAHIRSHGLITRGLRVYDPVPKAVMRVAGAERAQLLIESDSRKQLQEVLEVVDRGLRENSQGRISKTARVRWLIERDPITI